MCVRTFLAVWLVAFTGSIAVADNKVPDFPEQFIRFQPYAHNPVFTARGPGHWDVKIRERGWILHEKDGYHMWFTGYDGERSSKKLLGYASSTDGIRWERRPQPLVTEHWIEDMMVVPHEGRYYMFAEGKDDQAHLLVSDDGLQWERIGPLDVRTSDGKPIEKGPYGTPTAYFEAGTWYLFYERRDAGVWLATSTDRSVWTNVVDTPVLEPGPHPAESTMIALNQIIKHDGNYFAYYHGKGTGPDWSTHIAVSSDLLNWIKYPGNPILSENKSSGILVSDGSQYRLYSMHDQVHLHLPVAK